MDEPRPYGSLKSVERVTRILELLAEGPLTASQVSERLGTSWTTTHRSLTHLVDARLVRREEPSGLYAIGPHLYALGSAYLRGHPLLDAAATELRALANRFHAPAQLNEREGLKTTVLLSVDASRELVPKASAGHDFPLNAGSNGHVLLAFSAPDVLEELLREPLHALTEHTLTDADALRARVAEVRRRGWAVTHDDIGLGTGSVAAPVFGAQGELVGAVCLIVDSAELRDERGVQELVAAVTGTARQASTRLGWRYDVRPGAMTAPERT